MTKKIIALALAAIMTGNVNISAMSQADFVAQEVAAFVAQSKEAGLSDDQIIELLEKSSTIAPALTARQRNALIITASVLGVAVAVVAFMKWKKLGFFADKVEDKKKDADKDADKKNDKKEAEDKKDEKIDEGNEADKAKDGDKEEEQIRDELELQNDDHAGDVREEILLPAEPNIDGEEREDVREVNREPIIELPEEVVREIERVVEEVEHIHYYDGDVIEPVDVRENRDREVAVVIEPPVRRAPKIKALPQPKRIMPDRPGRGQGVAYYGFAKKNR